jgi:hypothetical protein
MFVLSSVGLMRVSRSIGQCVVGGRSFFWSKDKSSCFVFLSDTVKSKIHIFGLWLCCLVV